LSAEEGSGNPRRKVFERNGSFTRAFRKSGRRLSEDEIRAEAHKRQKEMRDAARAAEMAEGEVALEKLKDLAGKEAARRAATGQAGKDKRVSEEAARKAATGQASKVKRVSEDAAHRAATGQADKGKHTWGEAERLAAAGQAGKDKHVGVEASRKAATGQNGKNTRAAGDATRWRKRRLEWLRRSRKRPRSSANRGRCNASFMRISPARPTRRSALLGVPRRLASSTILTSPG